MARSAKRFPPERVWVVFYRPLKCWTPAFKFTKEEAQERAASFKRSFDAKSTIHEYRLVPPKPVKRAKAKKRKVMRA